MGISPDDYAHHAAATPANTKQPRLLHKYFFATKLLHQYFSVCGDEVAAGVSPVKYAHRAAAIPPDTERQKLLRDWVILVKTKMTTQLGHTSENDTSGDDYTIGSY